MKAILGFVITCIVVYGGLQAQNTDPAVTAAGGGIATGRQVQLEWTLGEPVAATATTSGILLTEGYHQPSLEVEIIASLPFDLQPPSAALTAPQSTATIFPNPVASSLTLRFNGGENSGGTQVELINSGGKILLDQQVPPGEPQALLQLGALPPGIYFLRCRPDSQQVDGRATQTFKVTKF